MTSDDASQVTRILHRAEAGDRAAANELLPLVYEQLRCMARQHMAQERADHTLQATALIHEVYLKLVGNREIQWTSRAHFYSAAAEAMRRILVDHAMRRILVDHARKRGRSKRGGDRLRVPLKSVDLAVQQNSSEILALDQALQRLQREDERMHNVVMLRFFAGLSVEDTASAMDVSSRTVKREWTFARAWLYRVLGQQEP